MAAHQWSRIKCALRHEKAIKCGVLCPQDDRTELKAGRRSTQADKGGRPPQYLRAYEAKDFYHGDIQHEKERFGILCQLCTVYTY